MGTEDEHEELDLYGDQGIASKDAPVPFWLKVNYVFWIFFGLMWGVLFWNGSYGWLDRGYWQELQRAANTTYPFTTTKIVQETEKADNVALESMNSK